MGYVIGYFAVGFMALGMSGEARGHYKNDDWIVVIVWPAVLLMCLGAWLMQLAVRAAGEGK